MFSYFNTEYKLLQNKMIIEQSKSRREDTRNESRKIKLDLKLDNFKIFLLSVLSLKNFLFQPYMVQDGQLKFRPKEHV